MNGRQRAILAIVALVIVLMILFPPYFGIDRDSGGSVHAFIGYHPRWNPPSAAYVYQRLTSNDPASADPARLSSFEARINVVRMIFNFIILGIAAAALMLALKTRAKPGDSPTR